MPTIRIPKQTSRWTNVLACCITTFNAAAPSFILGDVITFVSSAVVLCTQLCAPWALMTRDIAEHFSEAQHLFG